MTPGVHVNVLVSQVSSAMCVELIWWYKKHSVEPHGVVVAMRGNGKLEDKLEIAHSKLVPFTAIIVRKMPSES